MIAEPSKWFMFFIKILFNLKKSQEIREGDGYMPVLLCALASIACVKNKLKTPTVIGEINEKKPENSPLNKSIDFGETVKAVQEKESKAAEFNLFENLMGESKVILAAKDSSSEEEEEVVVIKRRKKMK